MFSFWIESSVFEKTHLDTQVYSWHISSYLPARILRNLGLRYSRLFSNSSRNFKYKQDYSCCLEDIPFFDFNPRSSMKPTWRIRSYLYASFLRNMGPLYSWLFSVDEYYATHVLPILKCEWSESKELSNWLQIRIVRYINVPHLPFLRLWKLYWVRIAKLGRQTERTWVLLNLYQV